ncbi:ComEA family DNA-binding protein [Kocuria rhizophila]|uniref:ComEA family DNA-binding protein n=1 Tax=Kocuria rhizophila TaxID=72000 RepID=UPI001CA89165|nr:ComEA family DNA-binding protein [Kocuria rhizophila]MDN3226930.1 ComEA family DNA-binding protein [Kocuria rhizophila]
MSGIDFRGRRRFRDSEATERLTALLRENGAGGTSQAVTGHQDDEHLSGGSVSREAGMPSGAPAGHAVHTSTGTEANHSSPGSTTGPESEREGDAGDWPGPGGSRHREDVIVRRRLSRPALVLLCVALLIALGVGCVSLLTGGSQGDAVVATASSGADSPQDGAEVGPEGVGSVSGGPSRMPGGPATGADRGTGTSGASAGTDGGVVTVHVVGEVKDPSVVTLSPGARVMDAVQAAGGFAPGAVKDRINLAEPVVDGAQIVIPNRSNVDEVIAAGAAPGTGARSAGSAPGGSTPGGSAGAGAPGQNGADGERSPGAGGQRAPGTGGGALVNLNTASQAELEELPKVGPVLAQRIVEFRTQHGAFTSPEQLDDVSGVGPAMLEALLPLVTV